MHFEGLSSVCAKLEPSSSKDNEILEINVLQKFTSYALLIKYCKKINFSSHDAIYIMILLYYYAETKEIIYELAYVKGAVDYYSHLMNRP